MTAIDLEGLRALLEKATPGPWRDRKIRYGGYSIDSELMCMNGLRAWFSIGNVYARDDAEKLMSEGAMGDAKDDVALIVAAVNALPALLDAIQAAAEREKGLETEIEGLRAALGPFAKFADRFGDTARDDSWNLTRNPSGRGDLTMGDVRQARSVLRSAAQPAAGRIDRFAADDHDIDAETDRPAPAAAAVERGEG